MNGSRICGKKKVGYGNISSVANRILHQLMAWIWSQGGLKIFGSRIRENIVGRNVRGWW